MTRAEVSPPAPGAVTRPAKPRVVGVDATRGVALLGMMAVHSLWAFDAQGNVTWTYALAAGRSAATFAVLAGIGIAFMTGRRQVPAADRGHVAASLATRALVVGAIGLALGFTDPELASVILTFYAVLFLLAIPVVFLSTRAVLVTGVSVALVVPVLSQLVRPGLPEPFGDNPSLGLLLEHPLRLGLELSLTGLYPALPWMAYICVGVVIGRLRLTDTRVAAGLLAAGVTVALAAAAVSGILLGALGGQDRIYAAAEADGMSTAQVTDLLVWGPDGTTPTSTWWWLASDAPHSTTPVDLAQTGGSAVALLGGMLLLARVAGALLVPLAAAGGMTLTLYTAHVLFVNSPFDVLGATAGYVAQVVAVLAIAVVWRARVGRGPLEALTSNLARRAGRAVRPRRPVVLPHHP
ncbi:heparan-alpha-glucosaminide N-acetyltransferase domain-containing protein [Georgenia sp. SYP-B2076]|uniref:heparan-alpha-glucosaminide N-acetyltransferase domain-containing protein n=1 Tax=Georgenia sp. SYP-B2076 TaxID=2495881 RepID=UPI000F8E34AF|nr:heparan-alpha-glucosaminide N-acetyltransferase domain-containing protein [Georgenia sp. SYP-B2076]